MHPRALIWFGVSEQYGVHKWSPHNVAFLASFGPVLVAQGCYSIDILGKSPNLSPTKHALSFETCLKF